MSEIESAQPPGAVEPTSRGRRSRGPAVLARYLAVVLVAAAALFVAWIDHAGSSVPVAAVQPARLGDDVPARSPGPLSRSKPGPGAGDPSGAVAGRVGARLVPPPGTRSPASDHQPGSDEKSSQTGRVGEAKTDVEVLPVR